MKNLAETKQEIGSQKSEDIQIQFFKMAQLVKETVLHFASKRENT